ncbi:MAG TPA: hypothetical protein VFX59_16455, partial [Polyangiales bacterium]|nr:hypothetical protein [Polyangiales bacterium]
MIAGVALAIGGCASRTVPASYPVEAASSPRAAEAAPAHVTVALNREPPLPGQSSAGWPGLAPGDPAHTPAAGHHHHHGAGHAGH